MITFIDRINEKQRRLREVEELILSCVKLFALGAGAAVGCGLFLCFLAAIC